MTIRSIVITLTIVFTLYSCKTKNNITVNYFVTIVPKVDSLPCVVNIEYTLSAYSKNNRVTEQISSNWTTSTKCHYDDYITLKATSVTNIKSLQVRIDASYGNAVDSECALDNCIASVRKDLYGE